jgi:hypothetical protein
MGTAKYCMGRKGHQGRQRLFSLRAYSYISWNDVKDYLPMTDYVIEPTMLDETTFGTIFDYIKLITKCVRTLEGKEAKRMFYIVPIIVAVCSTFDDVEILVEDDLVGSQVHANGCFRNDY